jgi:tetratricopeptide (TPR) repeat protein
MLPQEAPLTVQQQNELRSLGVSVETLGHILRESGESDCIQHYHEAIRIFQRIQDKPAEAAIVFNLGHAYKDIRAIRNLDAAERAYRRSLELRASTDTIARPKTIKQIGMVHHERFREAVDRNEPAEVLLRHAQATENHYLEALRLHPKDAVSELGSMHASLANLYEEIRQHQNARKHFESAIHYMEMSGDRLVAGQTRFNMAFMYARADADKVSSTQYRANLERARAYAEAAFRDFQHYQGRAANEEAKAKGFLEHINKLIAMLPQTSAAKP